MDCACEYQIRSNNVTVKEHAHTQLNQQYKVHRHALLSTCDFYSHEHIATVKTYT